MATSEASQAVQLPKDDLVPPETVMHANWLYDQRELLRLRRLKLAQQWGVPQSLIEGQQAHGVAVTQQLGTSGGLSKMAVAGIAAVALLAGGGGTAGLMSLLKPEPPAPAQVAPAEGYWVEVPYQWNAEKKSLDFGPAKRIDDPVK